MLLFVIIGGTSPPPERRVTAFKHTPVSGRVCSKTWWKTKRFL